MSEIRDLSAIEVLDSRGRPTIKVRCVLSDGATGSASVPSGASRGKGEAVELRDGDLSRYRGQGCRLAVRAVNDTLASSLEGLSFGSQAELDSMLIQIDGTDDKSNLGANSLLGVSLAYARAAATAHRLPLHAYLRQLAGLPTHSIPTLTVNLFSGGLHAGGQVSIQDVLIVPLSVGSIVQALPVVYDIYQAAAHICSQVYGMRFLTADEGGLAPPADSSEAMIADAIRAIELAGYQPGQDVAIAVDVAASHFRTNHGYLLDGAELSSIDYSSEIERWLYEYPIVAIEDPFAEEDWDSWRRLTARVASHVDVIGDDLLCTSPERLRIASWREACNGLLLKANQVGTLSESADSLNIARRAAWTVTASARSGETEDNWLADLAVGWGCDYIKIGSITQSDRLAKYNRLLELEEELT